MRISKATEPQTENFASYEVYECWAVFGWVLFKRRAKNVVTADSDTGELVQQVHNGHGSIYTNGIDEIILGSTERLLLLSDGIRDSFLNAGFRPKLTTRYANLQIRRNG